MQPAQDLNQVFSTICPQIRVNLRGWTYSGTAMHMHLIHFCNENYKLLSQDLKGALKTRNLDLTGYLYKMQNTMTSGLEVILLILSCMYRCGIMVIRSDFVWLSHNIKPELCPIIIVQNATGQFMGTHVKKPLYVCEFVESFPGVRSKKAIVTSTPQRDGSIGNFGPSAQEDLSPIAEVSTLNTSTELLCRDVAQFEGKKFKHESDSGEGDEDDVDDDDDPEDDEESEDGSDDGDDSENSSKDGDSKEEFEPGTDDVDEEEESESTDMLLTKIAENRVTVNTDTQKENNTNKSVHLRIEHINFTYSSPNIEVRNSKTTPDSSATVDVTND